MLLHMVTEVFFHNFTMSFLQRFYKYKHPDSFHGSMRPLLLLAQICGLLPVRGIFDCTIRFTWSNVIHLYGFMIFVVSFFFDSCYTIDNFRSAIRIDVFASTVFYTVCLFTMIFFLEIAKELPKIFENFAEIETQMKDYGYPRRLGLKVKIFLFSFIILAIIEHGALVIINVKYAWTNSAKGEHSFGYLFYTSHFPAITKRLPYSGLGTIVLFWVNAMCTFNWNYTDFFLIVISMETYSRFTLINLKLKKKNLSNETGMFWDKISKDYNRISVITKMLDRKLSKVILTSFFSNLYHLSLQLVRSLKISGTLFQMTYFYCSLAYLIVRLLLVLFFAAKINDESKKPFIIFLSLDDPCPEAIRFFHQVHTDDIALTGNKFFIIDKKFFVTIIGTIITYQGVLLQFNSLQGNNLPLVSMVSSISLFVYFRYFAFATTIRKGIKWYRKLGIQLLLGISVVNALTVYKIEGKI